MNSHAVRVDEVIVNEELANRPGRSPDFEAESLALVVLAEVMAESPKAIFQKLADTALQLCRADSAGISVAETEDGKGVFRWHATAGDYAPYLGRTMSREFSPCGTALDRNVALLMAEPARMFPSIAGLNRPVVEVLLTPFYRDDIPIGTIWAVAHTPEKRFDAEDARLLNNLSRFASAAVHTLKNLEAIEAANRELRDAQLRLQSVLEDGAVGTWMWNILDDRVVADKNLARLFSVSPEDAAGGPVAHYLKAIHPEDRERVSRVIDETVRSGIPYEAEYRVVQLDGSCRWVIARGRLDSGNGTKPRSLSGALFDVTDQKLGEERSRLLSEAAEVLLTTDEPHAMLQGIFTRIAGPLKIDTYFNYMVNESGDALLLESCSGIPEDEAKRIGRLNFGQAICGTVAARRKAIVKSRIQDSKEPMVQLVRGYGIRAYACNPLLAGDRLIGTLSFASRMRDAFEPAELEFFRTIASYVTNAYVRLALIRQLRHSDRRKDEFLAMLAHELRNPLAAVSNAVTVLKMANDSDNVAFAKDVIDRQTKQLARLIDDLLDVSRITSGKIRLRRELCDAGTILKQAIESAEPLIHERGHQLIMEFEEGTLPLRADPTRIEQIVVNLLTNAAKYTENGGRIRLSAQCQGNQVVIVVEDNGVGIPTDQLPQMFELFAQGERSIARSEGGLGIGLTIVQKLTEMHGGSVSAQSAGLRKGSTFTVRLPAALPPASTQEGPAASTAERRGSRILVVDDNVDTARSLVRLLKFLGNEVEMAHDGASTIDVARGLKPEFILLDIGLPGMDGYEVARRLRDDPYCRTSVIIAVSGYGQEEDRRRAREAGFDHHLVKPVAFNQLVSLLTQTV